MQHISPSEALHKIITKGKLYEIVNFWVILEKSTNLKTGHAKYPNAAGFPRKGILGLFETKKHHDVLLLIFRASQNTFLLNSCFAI